MQKIMFEDKYGMNEAVLEKRKTQKHGEVHYCEKMKLLRKD